MNSKLLHRAVNGWPLFWLISLPLCAIMVQETLASGLATGADISTLIRFSVLWAVPFIYIVLAASAVQTLFPGSFTNWWLRNRPKFGLCFAVAMTWQATFIYIMSNTYRDYYYEDVYLLRDELEGSVGYIFLVAMVFTTFPFGRRLVNQQQWKLIHTAGIYFLWAYPFSVYWWALYYYGEPRLLDYVYYWAGFSAFALRIVAWGKIRQQQNDGSSLFFKLSGYGVILAGLFLAAAGLQEQLTGFLTATAWSEQLVLWLPFWPFEPFLSLALVGLGTFLLTGPTATPSFAGATK